MKANLRSPLTLIAAEAGHGKTSLVVDFVERQSRPSVWYQMDHTDADPIVFLNYLAHGIKKVIPEFGLELFDYLSDTEQELSQHPESAVDLLIAEILRLAREPFILVLDDYDRIGTGTVVHQLVDRLLHYSSDLLHIIITSRDLPPLSVVKRRMQTEALIIGREDLQFTPDEVRQLFKNSLELDLSDDEVEAYIVRTQGWVTALALVKQLAENEIHTSEPGTKLNFQSILNQSEKDLIDYFAEEVFSREAAEIQKAMKYLSLLRTLRLKDCNLLFPDFNCTTFLPTLAHKNVFLTSCYDDDEIEAYRFHPQFRDFLKRRLRTEIGEEAVSRELFRLGNEFYLDKQWTKALIYTLDAERYEEAAELIANVGEEMIAMGSTEALGRLSAVIPEQYLDRFPWAILHLAHVACSAGETEKALLLLNRSIKLSKENGDTLLEAETYQAVARVKRRGSKPAEALLFLDKAENLVEHNSETFLKCLNTRGLCYVMQERLDDAQIQFHQALELAEALSIEHHIRVIVHNLALAPGLRGDFGEALRWFKRFFREGKAKQGLPLEATGHLNTARLYHHRGEYKETEEHLEIASVLCQKFSLKPLIGEIFEAYGNFHRDNGNLVRAGEYYDRAEEAYEAAEIELTDRQLTEERALMYLLDGESDTARTLLERLILDREKQNSQVGQESAKFRLYQVDMAEGKTEGLIDGIKDLVEYFRQHDHNYEEALAQMLLAEAYFRQKKNDEVLAPVRRVLDLSQRFEYGYWLRSEIKRNPEIFQTNAIFKLLRSDLRKELDQGSPAPPVQIQIQAVTPVEQPPDLTINILGHPEIFREKGDLLGSNVWTTKRSRDIFCHVATNKYRRMEKNLIVEMFWNDEDPVIVEKNFHPTISHIRKALNSNQADKKNFLIFRDGSYQLNLDLNYSIDSEIFDRHIESAETAKKLKDSNTLLFHLESAYALYRGEFMQGTDSLWVDEKRHYYAEQFARVVGSLAKYAFAAHRYSKAGQFATRLLAEDPYREDMHRVMMRTLAAQGKVHEVKKHYQNMRDLLADELGIEPSSETQKVAQEFLK